MGQDIIANALPFLSILLINFSPVSPSATLDHPQISPMTSQKIVWEVKENETLGGIAREYYGEEKFEKLLALDNPWLINTDDLDIGWRLKLRKLPLTKEDIKLVEKLGNEEQKIAVSNNYPQPTSLPNRNTETQPHNTPTPPSNFEDVYKEAGAKYGVPWQVLYGLHLTETGLRDGTIYNKSGSGARGPMQFMPGTFRAYGVDGDGDGNPNIDNAKDAIHSAANFLAKHGSLDAGLRSYGGNTQGVLAAARAKGYIY